MNVLPIIIFFTIFQQSTLERKKKNFSFSRKFPFMKSKDDKSEDGSDQERKFSSVFSIFDLSLLFNFVFLFQRRRPNIF